MAITDPIAKAARKTPIIVERTNNPKTADFKS